jgi:hypothetical protein
MCQLNHCHNQACNKYYNRPVAVLRASTRLGKLGSCSPAALLTQGEQWEGEGRLGPLRQSTVRAGEPPRRALFIGAL